jgi:hypothetical protein
MCRGFLSLVECPACPLPEYELIAVIVPCALDDLRGGGLSTARQDGEDPQEIKRKLRRRARRWFLSRRRTAGSFLWCCDLLGLDSDAV